LGLAITCQGTLREQGIANGIGTSGNDYVEVVSIQLPQPMQAGVQSSLSLEIQRTSGMPNLQIEFWAASAECGSSGPLEKFYTQTIGDTAVHCGSITPTTAHTHMLQVTRPLPVQPPGITVQRGTTICIAGACPAP
jgi:hypothetical protein